MDIYHGWGDLKPGVSDMELAESFERFMTHLKQRGVIEGWRLTRSKLGFSPPGLGEFHFMLEVNNLAQLDEAFNHVATRAGEVESNHHGVNSLLRNVQFALYRDFPDPVRQIGEEKF